MYFPINFIVSFQIYSFIWVLQEKWRYILHCKRKRNRIWSENGLLKDCLISGGCSKVPETGKLINKRRLFLMFWRLAVWAQDACPMPTFWWEPSSSLQTADFSVSPPMAGRWQASTPATCKGTHPMPLVSQKAPPSNTITLGLGFQNNFRRQEHSVHCSTHSWEGGETTQTQSYDSALFWSLILMFEFKPHRVMPAPFKC